MVAFAENSVNATSGYMDRIVPFEHMARSIEADHESVPSQNVGNGTDAILQS